MATSLFRLDALEHVHWARGCDSWSAWRYSDGSRHRGYGAAPECARSHHSGPMRGGPRLTLTQILRTFVTNPFFIWSCAIGLALSGLSVPLPAAAMSYIEALWRASLAAGCLVVGAAFNLGALRSRGLFIFCRWRLSSAMMQYLRVVCFVVLYWLRWSQERRPS